VKEELGQIETQLAKASEGIQKQVKESLNVCDSMVYGIIAYNIPQIDS